MVRKLALAAVLAATLASPTGVFEAIWSWAASLSQERPMPPPPQPTSDDDKGYSIDPNG